MNKVKHSIIDSFIKGIKSILVPSDGIAKNRLNDILNNGGEQDSKNLAGDWKNVGGYIQTAIDEERKKHEKILNKKKSI